MTLQSALILFGIFLAGYWAGIVVERWKRQEEINEAFNAGHEAGWNQCTIEFNRLGL